MTGIEPSYGPIAGGTEITLSGPYITNSKVELEVIFAYYSVHPKVRYGLVAASAVQLVAASAAQLVAALAVVSSCISCG